ncbi:MAG: hypothetical protein Q7T87_10975, partial [Polaromonas sp.]|nr:hypothetical protein [Polaromonas sp.]
CTLAGFNAGQQHRPETRAVATLVVMTLVVVDALPALEDREIGVAELERVRGIGGGPALFDRVQDLLSNLIKRTKKGWFLREVKAFADDCHARSVDSGCRVAANKKALLAGTGSEVVNDFANDLPSLMRVSFFV